MKQSRFASQDCNDDHCHLREYVPFGVCVCKCDYVPVCVRVYLLTLDLFRSPRS